RRSETCRLTVFLGSLHRSHHRGYAVIDYSSETTALPQNSGEGSERGAVGFSRAGVSPQAGEPFRTPTSSGSRKPGSSRLFDAASRRSRRRWRAVRDRRAAARAPRDRAAALARVTSGTDPLFFEVRAESGQRALEPHLRRCFAHVHRCRDVAEGRAAEKFHADDLSLVGRESRNAVTKSSGDVRAVLDRRGFLEEVVER